MRLFAPEQELEYQTLCYFLNYTIDYLTTYNPHDQSSQNEVRFEYIIDRLARNNIMSLLIQSNMKEEVPKIINTLINIQSLKGYSEFKEAFNSMVAIITGLLEELLDVSYKILINLLKNLNRKQSENKFQLCKEILSRLKNSLSGPINELMVLANHKELNQLSSEEYTRIIKYLSSVSKEYVIRFFSKIPFKDEKFFSLKIHNAKYWKILLKIFSLPNSFDIAKTYQDMFIVIVNKMQNAKQLSVRMKIFKCLTKFITRNKKEDLKQSNYHFIIFEKLRVFINSITSKDTVIEIIKLIDKHSYWKLNKLVLINFINSSDEEIQIESIKYTFEDFLNKKLFANFSIYEFNSLDRLKYLSKLSSLFIAIIKKTKRNDSLYNKQLINMFYKILHQTNGAIIFIILFYFSMSDASTSPDPLWNQIILGSYDELPRFLLQLKEEDNEEYLRYISKEVNYYNKKNVYYKNQKGLMFDFSNKAMMLTIADFLLNYLNIIDENSNCNYIKVINSIFLVLIYYIKYLLIIQNAYGSESIAGQFKTIETLVAIINKVIRNKISDRTVISTVMLLAKQMIDLKLDEDLCEEITNCVFEDLSEFVFEKNQLQVKPLTVIIYDLNVGCNSSEIHLPKRFEEYLVKKELINPIKFITEMIKLDKASKYNDIFFKEKIKSYLTLEYKEHLIAQMKRCEKVLKKNNSNEEKDQMIKYISLFHEVLKYSFYYIFKMYKYKDTYHKEINKFMKEILLSIASIIDNDMNSKSNYKKKKDEDNDSDSDSDSASDSNSELDDEKKEKSDLETVYLLSIGKYINLLFLSYEQNLYIKQSNLIRATNIVLSKYHFIRKHFIAKIEKRMNQKGSITSLINIIPIIVLCFNDLNKYLSKKSKGLIGLFVTLLLNRLEQNRGENNDKSFYKCIPEVYLSYIVSFFIFNANLNLLFQTGEKKYFSDIVNAFLRIVKQGSNNKYDSDFLLKMLNKMKEERLNKHKMIKGFFTFRLVIEINDYSYEDINYEEVKNGVIELIQGIITKGYMTDYRREGIKIKLPVIFLGNRAMNRINETNLTLNITKTFVLDTTKLLYSAEPKSKTKAKISNKMKSKENDDNDNDVEEDNNSSNNNKKQKEPFVASTSSIKKKKK